MLAKRALLTVMLLLGLLAAGRASAATLTYDFSYTSPNGTGFTDIVLYAEGGGQSDMFFVPGSLDPSGYASLTHTVSFEAELAMALGVSSRVVPTGEAPKWDILVLVSEDYLSANLNRTWGELFPSDAFPRHGAMTEIIINSHAGADADIAMLLSFFASTEAQSAMFDPSGTFRAAQFTTLTPLPTIPLPAALPLLASGLGALGFIGWRRKRKATAVAA